jgi:hypothetical protein
MWHVTQEFGLRTMMGDAQLALDRTNKMPHIEGMYRAEDYFIPAPGLVSLYNLHKAPTVSEKICTNPIDSTQPTVYIFC